MFPSKRITLGGPQQLEDRYSVRFDGTDDFITVPDTPIIGTGDFSISVWCKPDDIGTNYIISQYVDANNYWLFGTTVGNLLLCAYVVSGTSYAASSSDTTNTGASSTNDGKWMHFGVTWDRGGAQKIFVNGKLDGSNNINDTTNVALAAPIHIGRLNTTYPAQNIADIAFYDVALPEGAMREIYNERQAFDHSNWRHANDLQHWWRMGDGKIDTSGKLEGSGSGLGDDDVINRGVIGDEVNMKIPLGDELYTSANSLSTNEADDQSTGLSINNSLTVADETSIVSTLGPSSARSMKLGPSDTSAQGFDIDITSITTADTIYKLSIDARHIGADGFWSIRLCDVETIGNTGNTIELADIINSDTDWKTYIAYFIMHDTETQFFGAREGAGSNDGGLYVDNLSIKQVLGNPGVLSNDNGNTNKIERESPFG